MHGIDTRGSAFSWCKCNQGFSGEDHYERLLDHIKNPDPKSLASLIQEIFMMED